MHHLSFYNIFQSPYLLCSIICHISHYLLHRTIHSSSFSRRIFFALPFKFLASFSNFFFLLHYFIILYLSLPSSFNHPSIVFFLFLSFLHHYLLLCLSLSPLLHHSIPLYLSLSSSLYHPFITLLLSLYTSTQHSSLFLVLLSFHPYSSLLISPTAFFYPAISLLLPLFISVPPFHLFVVLRIFFCTTFFPLSGPIIIPLFFVPPYLPYAIPLSCYFPSSPHLLLCSTLPSVHLLPSAYFLYSIHPISCFCHHPILLCLFSPSPHPPSSLLFPSPSHSYSSIVSLLFLTPSFQHPFMFSLLSSCT